MSIFFFWIGSVFASFAGAVAWRLHTKKDFVSDRSECEHCKHKLSARDLVPIVSWVSLRGKCRYCRKPIGTASVVVEVLFGVLFLLSYTFWPFGFEGVLALSLFVLWCTVLVLMAILFVYDLRWELLPDKVVFPLIALSVVFFVLRMLAIGTPLQGWILEVLYALTPVAGVYGVLYAVSKGALIGFGDVKLGAAIGFLVGWQGALVTLLLSNVLGLLYVSPRLVRKGAIKGVRVPFGPFLIVATVLAFLWGEQIVSWYLSLAYI